MLQPVKCFLGLASTLASAVILVKRRQLVLDILQVVRRHSPRTCRHEPLQVWRASGSELRTQSGPPLAVESFGAGVPLVRQAVAGRQWLLLDAILVRLSQLDDQLLGTAVVFALLRRPRRLLV